MNLKKLEELKKLFEGTAKEVEASSKIFTTSDLSKVADIVLSECKDVVTVFKGLKKQWTWNPFAAYKIYQPVIKEIVEVVKVVGDQLKLSNDQKKELAEIICWKLIEPVLPKWVSAIGAKIIQWGISKAIEVILNWLKGKIKIAGETADSKVFKVASVQ